MFDQATFSNKPTVLAVTSIGMLDPTGIPNATIGVRTSIHKSFLVEGAKSAAAAGGYPVPAWAGGPDAKATGDAGAAPDAGATAGNGDPVVQPSSSCSHGGSPGGGPGAASAWTIVLALALAIKRSKRRGLGSAAEDVDR